MLDAIKNLRRKQILKELLAQPREKRIENLEEIKTIGVICRLDDEQSWNILYHFARVMEGQGKSVSFMALLQKEQELNFVVTHQQTYICRTKTDFNFWGLPSHESMAPFTGKRYNLLIDTLGDDNFFSNYVALSTQADLKATYAQQSEEPSAVFDLIIRGDGLIDLKDYFNNVIEYLSMIKK